MVVYNENEIRIIDHFKAFQPRSDIRTTKYEQYLSTIPQEHKRYKCHTCYSILNNDDLIDGKCPCGEPHLQTMCTLDHNGCNHPKIQSGVAMCPVCGEFVCTICHDHSVVAVSRITGYMAELNGWNRGKKAEFADRVRTDASTLGQTI